MTSSQGFTILLMVLSMYATLIIGVTLILKSLGRIEKKLEGLK